MNAGRILSAWTPAVVLSTTTAAAQPISYRGFIEGRATVRIAPGETRELLVEVTAKGK